MSWISTAARVTLAIALPALAVPVAHAQICGDADASRSVDVTDAVQTLRTAVGLASSCTIEICDVDGSGVVDVTDAVNVLRAAVRLPSMRACPTDITGFANDVEDGAGTDAALEVGVAPVPGLDAPATISDVQGDTSVEAGGSNALTVTYDTGDGAAAVAAAAARELIVGARRVDGSTVRGFFALALASPSGQVTVIVRFPPGLPADDFFLAFATRDTGGVGRIVTFLQQVGTAPTPTPARTRTPTPARTRTPTPTSTPFCGDGIEVPPETCDPPGEPQPPSGANCRADCTYCGDGIRNGREQCDGADRAACGAFACLPSCVCDQLQ